MFGEDSLNTNTTSTEARLLAQQRSEDFKAKKKAVFDGSHKPLDLIPGDMVKRRIPSNHPNNTKLSPIFKVVSKTSPVNYEIVKTDGNSSKFNIHVSLLEPYFKRVSVFSTPESETVITVP
jgi:hypothetical protein